MYYIIVLLLVLLGLLMQLEIFHLNDYVLACLNISALFFTISGIGYGSISSKNKTLPVKIIYYLFISLGAGYFLLAIIGTGFSGYDKIEKHIMEINPNSVLLIALAATIAAIVLGRKHAENKSNIDEKTIKLLREDITTLKNKINEKDMNFIELKDRYNELKLKYSQLSGKLNHTTDVMEKINRRFEGGKKKDEQS
ncbi:hypothetical protein [Paenibacillus xylanexedens]|uniref:hypothetical protein n=1 Tax=Paenibacillus xylanexedens TaxID=528191 RepID=UPI003CFD71F8